MDYQYDDYQSAGYFTGYEEPPYNVNRHYAALGTPPPFQAPPPPGGQGYGGHPHFAPPYGFNPSVPPPPVCLPPPPVCLPPQGHYPDTENRFHSFTQQFADTEPHHAPQQHAHKDVSLPLRGGPTAALEDETTLQRTQDNQWLQRFLQSRGQATKARQSHRQRASSVHELGQTLYGSRQLLTQLLEACETLRHSVDDEECVWKDSYLRALKVKTELQDKLSILCDGERLDKMKAEVSLVAKRRARQRRGKEARQVERKQRDDSIAEKTAAIDEWRMQQIREVEERKREKELKLAADTVLCEVRKKQADVKRMQDLLRSLDKLHRLRKEAAARKGIVTEQRCDQAFSSRLEQLRGVMKKRTAVYSAEENALMVMLEGEQEEERRRERDKRLKKEKEARLRRKRRMDAMLFGDGLPDETLLRPFREFYTQAERSLHVLLQVRRDWDAFAVEEDHPGSSAVPQGWVLPNMPSDQAWASARHATDSEGDDN